MFSITNIYPLTSCAKSISIRSGCEFEVSPCRPKFTKSDDTVGDLLPMAPSCDPESISDAILQTSEAIHKYRLACVVDNKLFKRRKPTRD